MDWIEWLLSPYQLYSALSNKLYLIQKPYNIQKLLIILFRFLIMGIAVHEICFVYYCKWYNNLIRIKTSRACQSTMAVILVDFYNFWPSGLTL